MQNNPIPFPLDTEKLCQLMTEVFAQGGTFRFLPTGMSMLPTLRERRDSVMLCSPAQRPPKKYDVILYRRENGQFVLHRIIGTDGEGFILCGDHQYLPERGIRREQVLGVLCSFRRGNREVSADARLYRCYVRFWVFLRPLRGFYLCVRRRFARFLHRK